MSQHRLDPTPRIYDIFDKMIVILLEFYWDFDHARNCDSIEVSQTIIKETIYVLDAVDSASGRSTGSVLRKHPKSRIDFYDACIHAVRSTGGVHAVNGSVGEDFVFVSLDQNQKPIVPRTAKRDRPHH